ncbi:MAG: hypothetical protein A3I26_00895 [Candidatus Yanofskybacteria bacterium RIFCSPLOWO2_02_FULL_43_10]|uniref:Uncharacterized protein n=1 Tax=Candidatus Yanofskybacteria bacterium RIFCSPLOWO2_12_FULL_43_11b TaxID=1802710 RepID=A0A1F8HBF9_9BACT|nr:MAG: hypothetical protein A3C69_01175 [Candidatus Yanofskybacteria bacterium RIFCSPHIGHO2_02_FULL_43_12]OGN29356.1 MAG: hypothetical protein A3I26_00895 [Candidatus Yanofskybacteria bacterium RIFCSPLOWO2_02_FULL_43_10]OGN34279.1 MAG: hypothetical protein A3G51_00225 [Candidatus Yanofskybacteria bacterium RIFCSPLOWO2_12_FULL_43_11b]
MKNKRLPKTEQELFRVFQIGTYRLLRMIITNKDRFMQKTRELDSKYGIRVNLKLNQKEMLKTFNERSSTHQKNTLILNSWPKEKKNKFLDDISYFTHKSNFGREWEDSITTFFLQGIICPPVFNLYIDRSHNRLDSGRIIIVLNPNTAPKDIKTAWEEIERRQKKIWPKSLRKRENATSKKISYLIKYWHGEVNKFNMPNSERYPGLNGYQRDMVERGRFNEVVRAYRESGQKVPRLIIKKSRSDGEIGRKYFGIKNKRKGADIVKQTRKQIKKW